METLSRHLPVCGQEGIQELMMFAVRFEEKMYAIATSQQDYLRKISLKMLTFETNPLRTYAANSGWNAHGPVMTMGATTYETTSGPEVSDKEQSKEEDDGDVSKEDSVEEEMVTKERNYVVGHTKNVKVETPDPRIAGAECTGLPFAELTSVMNPYSSSVQIKER